jgi:cell division protein FtsL
MNANNDHTSGLYPYVRRALEGRVTPLMFLIILGFFSSLVLLYISLNVHFFNMSNEIVASRERLDVLTNANVRLMAVYNELSAPGRIIPMAKGLGMRAGASEEMRRVALHRDAQAAFEEFSMAEAAARAGIGSYPGVRPRMAR